MKLDEILGEDEIAFLKELGSEMATQDTRYTAQPYGLIIQRKEKFITNEDYADNWTLFCEGDVVAENLEEAKRHFIEQIEEEILTAENDNDKIELANKLCGVLKISRNFDMQEFVFDMADYVYQPTTEKWVTPEHGMIFTFSDKEAKNYANKRKNYRSYGVWLGDSPKMTKLCEILIKIGEA